MIEQDEHRGWLSRWLGGWAPTLMREPAIILLERDGDGPHPLPDMDEPTGPCPAMCP